MGARLSRRLPRARVREPETRRAEAGARGSRSRAPHPPEVRLPGIKVVLAGVSLWLLLGAAAQLAIRLAR